MSDPIAEKQEDVEKVMFCLNAAGWEEDPFALATWIVRCLRHEPDEQESSPKLLRRYETHQIPDGYFTRTYEDADVQRRGASMPDAEPLWFRSGYENDSGWVLTDEQLKDAFARMQERSHPSQTGVPDNRGWFTRDGWNLFCRLVPEVPKPERDLQNDGDALR